MPASYSIWDGINSLCDGCGATVRGFSWFVLCADCARAGAVVERQPDGRLVAVCRLPRPQEVV